MYTTINFSQFCDKFRDMNRDNNFSYGGKRALFNYLDELEEAKGRKIELDVIALCRDFTEWDNLEEFKKEHNVEFDIETVDELLEHIMVIKIEGEEGFITQNF